MEYPTFLSSSPCFFLLLDPARDFTFEDVFAERNEQEGCLFEYHFFEADHIAFKPQVSPSSLSFKLTSSCSFGKKRRKADPYKKSRVC